MTGPRVSDQAEVRRLSYFAGDPRRAILILIGVGLKSFEGSDLVGDCRLEG